MTAIDTLTDGDLISMYQAENSEAAIRTLVNRHHGRLYSRFLKEVRNEADARDLEQQLWLRVVRDMKNYREDGKFGHFLSRIATNLLNDHWRATGRKNKVFAASHSTDSGEDGKKSATDHAVDLYQDPSPDGEKQAINDELVRYLVTVLIPALPVEQRAAWLLRHESEYWEPESRFEWKHLAELNGLSTDETWQHFETAREKMMVRSYEENSVTQLLEQELLVFLVWTQAQRLNKEQQFTWSYFALLLGVPENTMKTRYRTAQKTLSDSLKAHMQA